MAYAAILGNGLETTFQPIGKVLVFAYGANMHPSQIAARCIGADVIAPACLADHRVAFFGSSPIWDGALETVVPEPGRDVWGVVYALSHLDADSLDAWQDARFDGTGTYFHYPTSVVDALGGVREVLLYKKDMLGAPGRPSCEYLDFIVQGAVLRGLPPDYVAQLRGIDAAKASYPVPVPRRGDGLRSTTCVDCGSLV